MDNDALRLERELSTGRSDSPSPSSSGTKESSGTLHCMANKPMDGVLVKESSASNMTMPDDVDIIKEELEEPCWFCLLDLTMAKL